MESENKVSLHRFFWPTRRSRVRKKKAFWGILKHKQQVIAYFQTHYDYGPQKMPLTLAVGREERKQNNNKQTLPEKKEVAGNVSEQRDKGWIRIIRVQDTTCLAVTTTMRGSRRSRTAPHKGRLSGLVKHQDYSPTRTQETKGQAKRKTVNGKNQSLAQPQTLTQRGHEIANQTKLFHLYI